MLSGLIGRKLGMTELADAAGRVRLLLHLAPDGTPLMTGYDATGKPVTLSQPGQPGETGGNK